MRNTHSLTPGRVSSPLLCSSPAPKLALAGPELRHNQNAVKVRNGAGRTSPETYRHAGHKTSTFSFRKEWSYFCFSFELLQDGAPQTLKCPLCPEGVSLSAAKSDRQSGALKAHTPFSPQRLRSQTPGLGSVRHTPTRTLPGRVCSEQRARVNPPPLRGHSKRRVNSCASPQNRA